MQTLGDVELRVAVPFGTTAKACDVAIKRGSLRVGLKGAAAPIVDAPLSAEVKPEDSFWTVEDRKTVVLSLSKAVGQSWWTHCLAGDPVINTRKARRPVVLNAHIAYTGSSCTLQVEPENSKLSDLDGDTRTTVEKMMYDQKQKALGRPTSEEEAKQGMLKKFMEAHPEMDFSQAKFMVRHVRTCDTPFWANIVSIPAVNAALLGQSHACQKNGRMYSHGSPSIRTLEERKHIYRAYCSKRGDVRLHSIRLSSHGSRCGSFEERFH